MYLSTMRKGRKGNRRMQSHLHNRKKVRFDQKIDLGIFIRHLKIFVFNYILYSSNLFSMHPDDVMMSNLRKLRKKSTFYFKKSNQTIFE